MDQAATTMDSSKPPSGFHGAEHSGLTAAEIELLTAEAHIAGVAINVIQDTPSDDFGREPRRANRTVYFGGRTGNQIFPRKDVRIENTYDWYHRKILEVSQAHDGQRPRQ